MNVNTLLPPAPGWLTFGRPVAPISRCVALSYARRRGQRTTLETDGDGLRRDDIARPGGIEQMT